MTTFVLLNFLDFSASKRRFVLCAMWQRSVRCAERDPSILMRYEFSSTLYSAGIHVTKQDGYLQVCPYGTCRFTLAPHLLALSCILEAQASLLPA